MISDDLASLLPGPDKPAALALHTGKVLAWNSATGENQVEVSGAPLDNLPMLNLGDTVNLEVDDVVALLRFKNTFFIVGRVVAPFSESIASGAVLPATGTFQAGGYALTTSEVIVGTQTLTGPLWSNAVSVMVTMHATGRNNRGVRDYHYCRLMINGANGVGTWGQADAAPNPSYANVSTSMSASGLLPGGTPFDISAKVWALGGTWTADATNQCDITYSVMFFKV